MDELLSGSDVNELAGRAKNIMYPELKRYKSVDELFGSYDKVILLYLNDKNRNFYTGHWTCLSRPNPHLINFFDPYGLMLEDQKKWHSKAKNEYLNQQENILAKLLLNFVDSDSRNKVEYNEFPFQADGENINTCGRWVGFYLKFANQVPMKDFQNVFKKLKKQGYDLDKVITYLT